MGMRWADQSQLFPRRRRTSTHFRKWRKTWRTKKKEKCSGNNPHAGARTLTVHSRIHRFEGCIKSAATRCANLKYKLAAYGQTEWVFFSPPYRTSHCYKSQREKCQPWTLSLTGQTRLWPCLIDNCRFPDLNHLFHPTDSDLYLILAFTTQVVPAGLWDKTFWPNSV